MGMGESLCSHQAGKHSFRFGRLGSNLLVPKCGDSIDKY
jgi:hypothetical protein